ncbi:two-component system sensor histidine kinase VanS [Curtobacterium herbarum]|uniref:sensor histidine kinase n=1 Tax=Curtobacterium herbarum TaxID=150122 RepID=UPI0020A22FA9|nr:HAMP domain-containing sensor histidine kinase [Curtobacterium herbarum]MCP1501890.1 two-component system sensor histidine kinase VanS [Curtobacterium herbarum]
MTEQPRRLTIRLRLTLTYTALILLTGGAMLAAVFAVLAIVPGYAFTAGPFPYGTTHDLYTINGRDDVLRLFLIVSLPALVVIGGVGGVVSWFVAGRLLQPLRQIAATAERLDDRNLDARIAVDGPHDEIRDVADTVNAMLDRLEASFTSRSRFTANASHELRTPLASMKTMLQVALRSDHPPETARTLDRLHTTVDQMTSITAALLELARGDSDLTARPIALRNEVASALRAVDAELVARRLRVSVHLDDAVVPGEPVLVRQLVVNLVRNAVVHNVPAGTIDITVTAQPDVRLTVANDGRRITAAEAATLTEPFRRLDRTRSDGSGFGLGLALVQKVATAHGATLDLTPRDDGGLLAVVAFPALDDERQPDRDRD